MVHQKHRSLLSVTRMTWCYKWSGHDSDSVCLSLPLLWEVKSWLYSSSYNEVWVVWNNWEMLCL